MGSDLSWTRIQLFSKNENVQYLEYETVVKNQFSSSFHGHRCIPQQSSPRENSQHNEEI